MPVLSDWRGVAVLQCKIPCRNTSNAWKGNNNETNDEKHGDVNWLSDAGGHAGVRVCAGR